MVKVTDLSKLCEMLAIPADALAFVMRAGEDTADGRYDFGVGCYVNVAWSDTSCERTPMEAHEVYTDVQVLLSGEERIYYTEKTPLTVATPYDGDKDIAFYAWEQAEAVDYRAGEAIILPPCDAHLPCRAVGAPMRVKKAVVKVKG